ncbi:MAG TPA: LytTR family DNA-binding domain-containing protein [Candidatus Sulfotelmatobacter sp.]|nr:LytTR family DNA-binding domain-containing protein [Candidatus Sulfotelmatobacter sp.]
MNVREVQDQKDTARETYVRLAAHDATDGAAGTLRTDMIPRQSRRDYALKSTAEDRSHEPADTSLLRLTGLDATKLLLALQQLEGLAKRQAPRIAFKVKGRILLLDLAEIVAVRAEGNYVSVLHPPKSYLLHESLSSMAERLGPYGFIRIHRSVVVNISAVEEIQPLPTGEYRLRVKGGKDYLVTRTYKNSLRDLAQLWVGSEHLCS